MIHYFFKAISIILVLAFGSAIRTAWHSFTAEPEPVESDRNVGEEAFLNYITPSAVEVSKVYGVPASILMSVAAQCSDFGSDSLITVNGAYFLQEAAEGDSSFVFQETVHLKYYGSPRAAMVGFCTSVLGLGINPGHHEYAEWLSIVEKHGYNAHFITEEHDLLHRDTL